MSRVTVRRPILRLRDAALSRRVDVLAAEEPLEIRLDGRPLTVTMRTPGDDFDLAAGFLVSEGAVGSAADIGSIRYCAGATADGLNTYNVLDVRLGPGVTAPAASLERNFYTTSSCGVCGKASLEAVRTVARWEVAGDPLRLDSEVIGALPDRLRSAQRVFDRTGGLHAAGLFTPEGEALCVREDVGRHNAVDKILGWAVRGDELPLASTVLMVSGRASFELVQKAVMAGIPALAAVSAPSSLAAELAAECGLTLIGFLRGGSMNVYTGEHRIAFPATVNGR
ncbi:formate dehydrogenase accessory sulfurtransferase FdhD [Sphaerisporangium sp. TRM90804]|uniref:formate dehydrogenase accessory sulfurtransferase FdhD n=1 Tax=Sphaerisporangium sp. TRM90804 TaxID=3031113 RepID=UPI002449D456|nr:formate dehydrogenase accessory sulfurtransferase FdhD [Sphaerisporangium sp. TRM90804]MDH2428151.1 formate dehydrogenase accessory sulfurtransferase FdhD [Sphaerisporangium sp. TRM90804]